MIKLILIARNHVCITGVLQQTIPPQIYSLLLQNLEKAKGKVRAHAALTIGGKNEEIKNTEKHLKEEDVEWFIHTTTTLFPNQMAQCFLNQK